MGVRSEHWLDCSELCDPTGHPASLCLCLLCFSNGDNESTYLSGGVLRIDLLYSQDLEQCLGPSEYHLSIPCVVVVAQSCPTLWGPMDCSLPSCSFLISGYFKSMLDSPEGYTGRPLRRPLLFES